VLGIKPRAWCMLSIHPIPGPHPQPLSTLSQPHNCLPMTLDPCVSSFYWNWPLLQSLSSKLVCSTVWDLWF
jgi:hypothetical protein